MGVSLVIKLDGVRPSADIRAELADAGDPVLLAFSRGKDSIAAWLALRASGVTDIRPYYMYGVPRLEFVENSLRDFERIFDVDHIPRYPHASFYRQLNNFIFQPPEHCATIEAAMLPDVEYEDLLVHIKNDYGVDQNCWVGDGVRACDSIVRRLAMQKHGPMKWGSRKVSVVWDWQKADVMNAIEKAGVPLPIDYEWFGRSFDGLDWRFIEPISRNAPDDYERIKEWFPLVELEMFRHEL